MKEFWNWMRENNNTIYGEETKGYKQIELSEEGISIVAGMGSYGEIELDERMLVGYMIEYLSEKKIDWEVTLPFYNEKFTIDKLYFWLQDQIKKEQGVREMLNCKGTGKINRIVMITSENAKSAHPTYCPLYDVIMGVDFCLNILGPTSCIVRKGEGQCNHLKTWVWEDGDAYYCDFNKYERYKFKY